MLPGHPLSFCSGHWTRHLPAPNSLFVQRLNTPIERVSRNGLSSVPFWCLQAERPASSVCERSPSQRRMGPLGIPPPPTHSAFLFCILGLCHESVHLLGSPVPSTVPSTEKNRMKGIGNLSPNRRIEKCCVGEGFPALGTSSRHLSEGRVCTAWR